MVREIVRDPLFLARPSLPAGPEDAGIGRDLCETLLHWRQSCVGMAANMIGERKQIIAFDDGGRLTLLYNPELLSFSGPYQAEEGCLSLSGTRQVKRYRKIRVRYLDEAFRPRVRSWEGFSAQIIQHELDHCRGILV